MKIKVVNLAPSYFNAELAWEFSRDQNADISNVHLVDAPVNDMPSCVLQFKDFMILEREIFTSFRNHTIWARTSRVDNPLDFVVPDQFHLPTHHGHVRADMVRFKNRGEKQDNWRLSLPITSMTSWTARMSYREVVQAYKYFDYLCSVVTFQLRPRFRKVAEELRNVLFYFSSSDKFEASAEAFRLVKPLNEKSFCQIIQLQTITFASWTSRKSQSHCVRRLFAIIRFRSLTIFSSACC